MNLSTLPDSQRSAEILPEFADEKWNRRHIIGQEAAVMALMRVHIALYGTRQQPRENPTEMIHPIQESLYSLDGRVFALGYLALVGQLMARVKIELQPEVDPVPAISALLYPANSKRMDTGSIRACLTELQAARTLLVKLNLEWGSDDDEAMKNRLATDLIKSVNARFGLDLAMPMSLEAVVAIIPKPVLITLHDFVEISRWYRKPMEARRVVFKLTELVTGHMASQPGVYYLFQGRMSYLEDFGLPTPVGRFERIHLNPLSVVHARELVNRTLRGEEKLGAILTTKYTPKSLDDIVSELVQRSDGHAFLLFRALRTEDPLRFRHSDERHVLWLQGRVDAHPEAIRKHLFERRYDGDIDLEEVVDIGDGVLGTVGYLATQIHAGIGPNSRSSPITIPASLLKYMEGRFVSLSEYCKEAVSRRSNRETLVEILVRYFQAVFKEERTWGDAMGEFCPEACPIWDMRTRLNVLKRRDGSWIGKDDFKNYARTRESFGKCIPEYLEKGYVDLYRVAEGSESADIFIIPPEEYGLTFVAVKVVTEPLSTQLIEVEVARLDDVRRGMRWSPVSPRAVLMLCVFGPVLDQESPSAMWNGPNEAIMVVNLSRPDYREKFFKPAIPVDGVVSMIEELVARVGMI